MKEKVYVYIGRFQTAHIGHEAVIKNALKNSDRLVLLVGSADIARDPKNPFTFEERKKVLEAICERHAKEEWAVGHNVKFNILPLHDYIYDNNKWLAEVHSQVQASTHSTDSVEITLTGSVKENDTSTDYLNFFPHWKKDFLQEVKSNDKTINSTDVRKSFLETGFVDTSVLCDETQEFLNKFIIAKPYVYGILRKEHEFIENYKATMKSTLPYDTIPFLTGDALVTCAGNLLVGVRKNFPGMGNLCIPGGFFDAWQDKDQVDTAIRELVEETRIKVPEKVLRGNIRSVTEFGDFNRSLRWRIITKVVHIQLPDDSLPKIKGSDDLEKAFWMPLGEVIKNRANFFEDHFCIIQTLLNL